jgi:transposase
MRRHDQSPGTRLDDADRKRLAAALAAAREARVYRRLEALLLVAEGQSVAEVARRCRVDRSSVHRWLAQYRAEHEATALLDRPRSGRPRLHRTLTPRRLAAALARDPRRCGYQATSWTVPLLAHDLAAKGVAVSPRTLRRRLHEAGYRWKRPRYVYVQRAAHLPQKKKRSHGPVPAGLVK